MSLVRLALVAVFLVAGATHLVSLLKLPARVDQLANEGKLAKGGLSFFTRNNFVELRSIDEVLRRTDLAPDRSLRRWAYRARASLYISMTTGILVFLFQVFD